MDPCSNIIEYDKFLWIKQYNGYYYCNVNNNRWDLHRYIWFKESIQPLIKSMVVHHKDGNKNNNYIENLSQLFNWCHSYIHNKDKNNPFYNKKHSIESKNKMSNNRKGKLLSNDTKQKISNKLKGNKHPLYGKPSFNRKKVICIETGIIYDSILNAAKDCGLHQSTSICRCCKGFIDTVKGYHWSYYNG